MELKGSLQTYAWGKKGNSSLVARLYGEEIDPETTYAELWMGTHPRGNSIIKESNETLKEFLVRNPQLLGKLEDYWESNENLPFLFKVLSINKALSIQVHPDKDMAEMLHHNFPTIYHDPNYKPEMAIALTDFRALCGFRPIADIKDVCVNLPELSQLVSSQFLVAYEKTTDVDLLRKIIFRLLAKGEDEVNQAVQEFFSRLEHSDEDMKKKYLYTLIKELHQEFPGDPGIFMAFFLNTVHLSPGEAIYIPAGLPHAYLSGDCIECMACSDNVVRAGLTPKYKDIETLLDILDYQSYTQEGVKLQPEKISPYTTRYNPPIPDFGVSQVVVPKNESWLSPSHDSCQIFIVTEGEGSCIGENVKESQPNSSDTVEENTAVTSKPETSTEKKERREWSLKRGTIMFLPPYRQYKISSNEQLEIYFAYTNSEFIMPDLPLLVV